MKRRGEVEPTPVDEIVVRGRWRSPTAEQIEAMRKSLRENGLLTPVAVRIVDEMEIEGETWRGVPVLVFGATRLAAAIAEGWKDIDTQIFEGSDIDFEKAELAENLHRGELTKLQRDQQLARYIRLCEQEQEVLRPEDAKPQGGRPKGGVRAAARELNLPEATARKAIATEAITAPAAAAITELGLANSPSAYREVAAGPTAEAQIAKAREIAEKREGGKRERTAEQREPPITGIEVQQEPMVSGSMPTLPQMPMIGLRDLVYRVAARLPDKEKVKYGKVDKMIEQLRLMGRPAATLCDIFLEVGERTAAEALAKEFDLPMSIMPITYGEVFKAISAAKLKKMDLREVGFPRFLDMYGPRERRELSLADILDFRPVLERVGLLPAPTPASPAVPAEPAMSSSEESPADDRNARA